MLQGCVEDDTPNRKYHVRYVQDTETLLKTLAESIDKSNKRQKNAWSIRESIIEFRNIRRACIILLAQLGGRRNRPPEACYHRIRHRIGHAQPLICYSYQQAMCHNTELEGTKPSTCTNDM